MFRAEFAMYSAVARRSCRLSVASELDVSTNTPFTTLACLRLRQPDVDQLEIDLSGIGSGGLNAMVAIRNVAVAADLPPPTWLTGRRPYCDSFDEAAAVRSRSDVA
jgi:ATP-dependent protease HslVU (ClpYQ) peptidase subunit